MKDERVHRYFDGEMPDDERAAFEAEMTDEERAKLAGLVQMRTLLVGALETEAASVEVWREVRPQLPATKPAAPRRWSRRPLVGASAGLAFAAAALLVFLRPPSVPSAPTWAIKRLDVRGASVAVIPIGDGETPVIWTTEDE